MKKYTVRLEGRRFLCEIARVQPRLSGWFRPKSPAPMMQLVGFYATRLIEAHSSEEAALHAIKLVESEFARQMKIVEPSSGQVTMLWAKEVDEVPIDTALGGFTLYWDDEDIH